MNEAYQNEIKNNPHFLVRDSARLHWVNKTHTIITIESDFRPES